MVVIPDRVLRFGLKPLVFVASLAPAGWLVWAILTGNLSANPLSDLTNETGIWALRFVCITLAITPLRRITGWNQAIKFRRMAGLFAFFYGTLHFTTYVVVDRFASLVDFPDGYIAWSTARHLLAAIWEDIYKRPYITIGFSAWLTMLPLTLTSTAGMIRRLGGRTWNRLHKLVYATGVLVVVHYWWLVKADISRPAAYGVVVAVLLGSRLYWARVRSVRATQAAAVGKPLSTLQRSR
ncbi:MAG: sulfoxide reductase heme-binding subunit YedZ [Acidobacteria bacterium]|nr:sulfoxide reductase heme-binding subunit YedZ [Acidobacteriota bacterium]